MPRHLLVLLLVLVALHLILGIRMQDPEDAVQEWEEAQEGELSDEDYYDAMMLDDEDDDDDFDDDDLGEEGDDLLYMMEDEEDDELWDESEIYQVDGLDEGGPYLIGAEMELNGRSVPRLGFGTAGLGDKTFDAVSHALARGFRVLDTAAATMWYDEVAVGKAMASVAEDIPREEIILVTKIWPTDYGRKKTLDATERSLQKLNTTYVDLLLLHFPDCNNCDPDPERGTWLDAWRALEEVYRQGKAKAIGVSNFDAALLDSLLADAEIKPHDVQNWMDPYHQDRRVRGMCEEHGIHYTSYSTLGSQWSAKDKNGRNPVLTNPIIKALATRYEVSPILIVLSWALQENVAVIPRSSQPEHIDELAELMDGPDTLRVYLSEMELDQIDELDAWGPDLWEHYGENGFDVEEGAGRDEL